MIHLFISTHSLLLLSLPLYPTPHAILMVAEGKKLQPDILGTGHNSPSHLHCAATTYSLTTGTKRSFLPDRYILLKFRSIHIVRIICNASNFSFTS